MKLLGAARLLITAMVTGWPASQSGGVTYEPYFISSGNNFPAVDLRRDSLAELEVALHLGKTPGEIAAMFHWPDSVVRTRLALLYDADLASRDSTGGWHAGVMVMTFADTASALRVDRALISTTARAIESRLPSIRATIDSLPGFKGMSFDDVSLLVLSDGLLYQWQLDSIEARVIASERPLHKGKRFYSAIQERRNTQDGEPFGIYGNSCCWHLGGYTIALYGNRRGQSTLSQMSRNAPTADTASLSRAGVWRAGALHAPVVDRTDDAALQRIAADFSDTLFNLLRGARPQLEQAYAQSSYASEVSFAEFFMWWYHLYYTAVTDALVADHAITPPSSRNIAYILRDVS
jgi:hypothetical protein